MLRSEDNTTLTLLYQFIQEGNRYVAGATGPEYGDSPRGGKFVSRSKTHLLTSGQYRFSFGPWNIHEGADPFGPTVRDGIEFGGKLKIYKELGFDGVQFHDHDAAPGMNDLKPDQNGLKFDEDKSFGAVDPPRAFNQVRILEEHDYGTN